jgi:predicted PurR-regulated permease PerM
MDITPAPRNHALGILATTAVLGILYFGRDVLIPITLAVILSLLIAPIVRRLRRLGLGHTSSVLAAVLVCTAVFAAGAIVIGSQLVSMAASLPQYEQTVRGKLAALDELTAKRLDALKGPAERIVGEITYRKPASTPAGNVTGVVTGPIAVEVHEPPASTMQLIERVISTVGGPLATAGIVLTVLLFVLLEQEELRDRFIRVVGGSDIRRTTAAINDAGARLSRFFLSQFAVNAGVGVLIWIGTLLIGLPYASLWGVLAAVMRFVPYVGIWIAALVASTVAVAVDPGWSVALMTLGLFAVVDTITWQIVEPELFGHTTGLSPLSVVTAAIFWSWLWGPVGLILSTPLTMCLMVAGRYVEALSPLEVLLGDTRPLTLPQRFYQRALSADADEITASARDFLKSGSFATYCDSVVMPALHLASLDLEAGTITRDQIAGLRTAAVNVVTALSGEARRPPRRRRSTSILDELDTGKRLRAVRKHHVGEQQRSVKAPDGSVVLCVGLGSAADRTAAELLVRVLREQKLDARHLALDELANAAPAGAMRNVSMVQLVSAYPSREREAADAIALDLRRRWGDASIVTVFLPGYGPQSEPATPALERADRTAQSFDEALHVCLDWHRPHASAST